MVKQHEYCDFWHALKLEVMMVGNQSWGTNHTKTPRIYTRLLQRPLIPIIIPPITCLCYSKDSLQFYLDEIEHCHILKMIARKKYHLSMQWLPKYTRICDWRISQVRYCFT